MKGWLVVVGVILASCSSNKFMGGVDLKDNMWREGQNATFEFDTQNMVNQDNRIDIFIRYLSINEGRDMTLYIKTQNSDNVFYIDTLTFKLVGSTDGSIRSMILPYREHIRWAKAGKHSMSISSAEPMDNIMSVGIEIF